MREVRIEDFPPTVVSYTEATRKYLERQGLDPAWLDGVQTCYPTANGLCFVLFGTLAYQERRTAGSPRFVFPAGAKLGKAVYLPVSSASDSRTELVIVEGTADALAVEQEGYRAVSVLGSNITEDRVRLLKSLVRDPQRVFYIPDNDGPGMFAITRLLLLRFPAPKLILLPLEFKDICQMPREERGRFLAWINSA